jgi:MoaA/NifB/PqqE/SkfB family radical SAM enzyme
MGEKPFEMPFLRSVGLVMTYQCQIACPHCIVQAGPHRREKMSVSTAEEWISQVAEYREGHVKVLSLSGGEPFFDLGTLQQISAKARDLGLVVTVVTNAFWAQTQEQALAVLKKVPAIQSLAFSTDEYHQSAIPLDHIRHALSAARACELPYHIMICTHDKNAKEFKATLQAVSGMAEPQDIYTMMTFDVGRANKEIPEFDYATGSQAPGSACSISGSPVIFPDGRVAACVGPIIDIKTAHPLVLGNLRKESLERIFDRAEMNVTLQMIRTWGPGKLVGLIEKAGLGKHLPKSYIQNSICHTCHALMQNKEMAEYLAVLATDAGLQKELAYARVHYLQETRMADVCGLASQ